MTSTVTCLTWRGMGSTRLYLALDSPCDENQQPYHTGSGRPQDQQGPRFPPIHLDGGAKHATGASSKIRGRDKIIISTWNTGTLRAAGKLQELTHGMDRYRWNVTRLREMRWKNFGETTTD